MAGALLETGSTGTATPTPNSVPISDGSGKLDGWISDSAAATKGKIALATAAEMETGTDATKALTPATVRFVTAKRTKMPDGAGVLYVNDATWSTWTWSPVITKSVSSGVMRITKNSIGDAYGNNGVSVTKPAGSILRMKARASKDGVSLATPGGNVVLTTSWNVLYAFQASAGVSGTLNIDISDPTLANVNDWIEFSEIAWGTDISYLPGSGSEEGIRILDQLGDTAGVGVAASGTITSNGTAPSDGDTVTIAGKAYAYKTTLGTTEGQVLIGASAAEAAQNLVYAVNYTGTPGTNYYCAAAHPLVSAVLTSSTVITLSARSTGELGNTITLAKSAATLTLSGATLTGGYSDAAAKIITATQNNIAGGGTRPAAAKMELTNTALIGYETTVDVAADGTLTLPAGGTWYWNVYGYGATISSAKRGSSAGGTTLTVAGANASVGYRRVA